MIINLKNQRGFTLIELLVVISIIGLLSSVVLTSLSGARKKALDSKKLTLIKQYQIAADLYRSDSNDSYPDPGDEDYHCLGSGNNDGKCLSESIFPENSTLNDAFVTYIPGPPPSNEPTIIGSDDYHGITYKCSKRNIDAKCTKYEMTWIVVGNDTRCAGGVGELSPSGEYVQCTLTSEEIE